MTHQDDDATARPQPPPDPGSGSAPLGPDASVREIARAARTAFLGADLIQSGPGLWPFGRRARTRRDRNRAATENARRRRAQFQHAFEASRDNAPRPPQSRPIDRRTNRLVIAALTALAAGVLAAAVWFGGPGAHPSTPAARPGPPAPAGTGTPAPSSTPPASATASGTPAVPAQPPIPSGGVTPITPRPHTPAVTPNSVVVVEPPAGDPSAAELATPEAAVRAWLGRLCPFDYRQPLGAAEQRARPAMTDTGWRSVDPTQNPATRASWDRTVAARESGRCAAPIALVSPEAPRSPTAAIAIGAVTRVVTPENGQSYVEQLSEVRIVRRGADGLWRVDLPTEGG